MVYTIQNTENVKKMNVLLGKYTEHQPRLMSVVDTCYLSELICVVCYHGQKRTCAGETESSLAD